MTAPAHDEAALSTWWRLAETRHFGRAAERYHIHARSTLMRRHDASRQSLLLHRKSPSVPTGTCLITRYGAQIAETGEGAPARSRTP